MTNQEAIEQLKLIPISEAVPISQLKKMDDAIDMAIEALEKVDKIQNTCKKVQSGNPEEIKDLNFAEAFVGLLKMVTE